MLDWLSVDGKKLLLTRILRTFAYGYLAAALGLYLDRLGLTPTEIGVVFTAAIAGSALMTVFWSIVADRYGRRRTVATMALLMAVGGIAFALTSSLLVLILAAFTGTISATSSEVGVFQTVEQAILPQTAPNEKRTWLFSIYNTIANVAGAFGSLFAASVGFFTSLGLTGADAYRPLFVLYAAIGLANFLIFLTLTDKVELAHVDGARRFIGIHRSTTTVAKLSALFGLDAFAGALVVQSIVAYWFFLRWGLQISELAVIFFWVGLLSGASLLVAGWLAARFGLLNTMVFTHLPSNVLLLLVPLAPSASLAIAFFLLRMSISQMDVPTRQAYTMAVVRPDERSAAAGVTGVARSVGASISPLLATMLVGSAGLMSVPFFLAGGLKIAYDVLLYRAFSSSKSSREANDRVSLLSAGDEDRREVP